MSDPKQPTTPHTSPFEAIRRVDEEGHEYWSARDLAKLLGYAKWDKFKVAIERAKEACEQSNQASADHFLQMGKMVTIGSGGQRRIEDIYLSRYACYLIVQNADPSKPIVALGQTYFAVQTRRQEIADDLALEEGLPEDQLRLLRRGQMNIYNTQLAEAAQHSGVIEPRDFAISRITATEGCMEVLAQRIYILAKGSKNRITSLITWEVTNWLLISLEHLKLNRS